MIIGADALGLPGRVATLNNLEGLLLAIATPVAKDLGLQDGQVVQAAFRLTGGQPELIFKGRVIQAPAILLSQMAPTLWLKVVQTPQGNWVLQPIPAPIAPGTQSTPSTRTAAPLNLANAAAVTLPIATPIVKDMGLQAGQVLQANVRLTGGKPELILKGRVINMPPGTLSQMAPTQWLKVVQSPQGGSALQPTTAPPAPSSPSISGTLSTSGNPGTGVTQGRPAVTPLIASNMAAVSLPIASPLAKDLGLQAGQVLQATFRLNAGQPELILNGRVINAQPNILAQMAPSLWLKAVQNPQGGWALQTTTAPLTPGTLGAQGTQSVAPLNAATAAAVSQVASPPPPVMPAVFSRMANLLFRPPGTSDVSQLFKPGTLDSLLQTLARPDLQSQWRGMQLSMAQLSPQAISNALASAVGAEVWLARGLATSQTDPKQFLRRVIQAMQNPDKSAIDSVRRGSMDDAVDPLTAFDKSTDTASESATFTQIQHAVDELESAQVQAVQAQSQGDILFRMTLPFVDANPVELVFRKEPRGPDQLPLLTVNVHSRSDIFGPVWLKTQIEGSQQIDLTMWAEKSDVASAARLRASELGGQLQGAGLNMRSFKIVHGARPASPADFVPTGTGLVLDMSA